MKVANDKSKGSRYKILCKKCKQQTNHLVLSSVDISDSTNDEFEYFAWEALYQIVQCLGCDEISFRMETSNSEDIDPENGVPEIDETIYPRRDQETINLKTYFNLPNSIHRLYKETIDCYNNEIKTLCGAGVRSLVEGICIENKIADGEVHK